MIHHIDELQQFVPPPAAPARTRDGRKHPLLGGAHVLPADYLHYCNRYGSGCFVDATMKLCILDITTSIDNDTLNELNDIYTEWHRHHPTRYPPVGVAEGHLLPWAIDDQGCTLFWLIKGHPDEWVVAVDDRSRIRYYSTDMGSFLYNNLIHQNLDRFWSSGVFPDPAAIRFIPNPPSR